MKAPHVFLTGAVSLKLGDIILLRQRVNGDKLVKSSLDFWQTRHGVRHSPALLTRHPHSIKSEEFACTNSQPPHSSLPFS